jgi:hypothetical protein
MEEGNVSPRNAADSVTMSATTAAGKRRDIILTRLRMGEDKSDAAAIVVMEMLHVHNCINVTLRHDGDKISYPQHDQISSCSLLRT